MVELSSESQPSSNTSQRQSGQAPDQRSQASPEANGTSTNGSSNEILTNGLDEEHVEGEWQTFEVQYTGSGIASYQVNDNNSDSSFASDSDDDQYEGYEPVTLQTLRQMQDSSSSQSEEEIANEHTRVAESLHDEREVVQEVSNETTSVDAAEVTSHGQTSITSLTNSTEGGRSQGFRSSRLLPPPPPPLPLFDPLNPPRANDITLDDERMQQITSAMAGFILPPNPNLPDDSRLIEIIKRITG